MRIFPLPAPLRRFTETHPHKKEDAVTASSGFVFLFSLLFTPGDLHQLLT